jgi:hypothetical protein
LGGEENSDFAFADSVPKSLEKNSRDEGQDGMKQKKGFPVSS